MRCENTGVGPLLGASLAAGFYKLIKALNYEEVNGSQDLSADEVEDKDEKTKRKRDEKEGRRARLFHHHTGRHPRGHHAAAPAAIKHQNTGAEQGIRRASTGGFHSHRPSGDQGSMYTPNTNTGGISARIPSENGAVMNGIANGEPRPQYTPSGERYVQDIWAQDRVQDRVQTKYDA
jgi:hypothetical protein